MAGILDSKIDMKLNVALLKTLQQANAGDKWTSARQSAYEEIDNLIEKFNGHVFFSDQRIYGLSTRGSHAVFKVPTSQGRNLKKFRGHLALIFVLVDQKLGQGIQAVSLLRLNWMKLASC